MLESLAETLACHRNSPDKTPARRLATLEAAGRPQIAFTTGILVGIGETRADRLAALRAIAASHARHGHVQEVIVQNFLPKAGTSMHAAAAVPARGAPLVDRRRPARAPSRDPPAGSAEPDRGLLEPARRRHRRLGRRVSRDGRPRQPRARLAGARAPARGDRGPRARARPAARGPSRVGERAIRGRRAALRGPGPFRRRGPRPRLGLVLGRRDAPPPRPAGEPPAPSRRPARRSPSRPASRRRGRGRGAGRVSSWARRSARTRSSRSSRPAGRRWSRSPRWPTSFGERRWATSVTFVANRNINYTNVCTFKCRFCAFSKGPLSLNLRGSPYLLELDEITRRVVEAEQEGATEVCLQGGIHPSFDGEYYLEVLEGGPGRLRAHPHPRLHRPRGRRGGPPARRAARDLPRPPARGRAAHPARHRGRDPRRRGPGDPVPGQGQHRAVAGGAPRRARRRPALERHDHVRGRRAAPSLGPAPRAHPGAAEGDGRVHRVRAAALRAHGEPRSTCSASPGVARRSARRS